MTSLSMYLEDAAFSISISSSVFIFQWLFSRCIMDIISSTVFISCPSLRTCSENFCESEVFPMFFESCVEVSVDS